MRIWVLLALVIFALPVSAHHTGNKNTAAICDAAARTASARHGVPFEILRALTRTETGRPREGRLEPWPWTINMEGAGHWFETRAEALRFALDHHARGARSFDVGCFQINFRWHGQAFDSIETMFDQDLNADYAARFLLELKAEGGEWPIAVGKYHSRTPKFATKYKARFERILARLDPASPAPLPTQRPAALGAVMASLNVRVSGPQHGRMPGAVALTAFSPGKGLLTRGKPLFGEVEIQ